jgi:hypothetical protein
MEVFAVVMLRNQNDLENTVQANVNLFDFFFRDETKLLKVDFALELNQIALRHLFY